MKRLSSLGEVHAELTRLRGTVNISEWLVIAKILRGRNLFLAIGKMRIANLEGAKALRDKLDEIGLPSSKIGAVIEAIVGLWIEKQLTGEIDLAAIVRGLEGETKAEVLIRQQLEKPAAELEPLPAADAIPSSPPPTVAAAPLADEGKGKVEAIRNRIDDLVTRDDDPAVWRPIARLQVELAAIHEREGLKFGTAVAYSYAAQYLLRIAERNSELEDYRRAIKCYDRALAGYRLCSPGHLPQCLSYAGETMVKIAHKTKLRADCEKAIVYLDEAENLFSLENNRDRIAYTRSFLGRAYISLAERETEATEKIRRLRQGLDYYKKAESTLPEKHLPLIKKQMGYAHLLIAQATDDIADWQTAWELLKKAAQQLAAAGLKTDMAYALGFAGKAAFVIAKRTNDPLMWAETVNCYLASNAALREGHCDPPQQVVYGIYYAARAQRALAILSGTQEDFEKATDYYLQAIALCRQLDGQAYAERIAECLGKIIGIAWRIFDRTGRTEESLNKIIGYADEMLEAAEICQSRECKFWALKHGAIARKELGELLKDEAACRRAIDKFLQARDLEEDKAKKAEISYTCGGAYFTLAGITREAGDYQKCVNIFEEALAVRSWSRKKHSHGFSVFARAQYELAVMSGQPADYEKTIRIKQNSLNFFINNHDLVRAANCCSFIGNVYYELALLTGRRIDMEMALAYILRADSLYKELKIDRSGAEEYFALDIRSRLG